MPIIHYIPDDVEIEVEAGTTILQASWQSNIPHTHVCGGNARCSTCRVMIIEGKDHCQPRNREEGLLARRLSFTPDIRLACQTQVTGDVTIRRLVLDQEDIDLVAQPEHGTREDHIGAERKVAILFSDIRNFTTFAEVVPAYDVIHILNRYFYEMDHLVQAYGGYVDNHIGDGIMALFGVEGEPDAALNAVQAGLAMLEAVERFRPYVQVMYPWDFQIGIGVHYGEVVIGTLGAINKKMTAIGDSVNFASRIESATKDTGVHFLISEDTYYEIKDKALEVERVRLRLKGKRGEHALYAVKQLRD
ncbi:MAG: adenylate/guanylate cyclase domain-containing protein [Anaerolineales bacterium]|nr:adenylate/guanylate cyclase domain-containing protein [Anaerolineales bacterium]